MSVVRRFYPCFNDQQFIDLQLLLGKACQEIEQKNPVTSSLMGMATDPDDMAEEDIMAFLVLLAAEYLSTSSRITPEYADAIRVSIRSLLVDML